MTDHTPKPTTRPTKAALKKIGKGGRPGGIFSGGLALIMASIALIGSTYLWYVLIYERQELLATDVVGSLQRLESGVRELREGLTTLEQEGTGLRENQDVLKAATERIQNDLLRNRTEWALSETEQLMVIANHRLQLARDIGSALSALRAADRQLNVLAQPNLLPVRRELAREIAALEALEKTDVAGMSLKLANLAERLDRLPLAIEVKAPPAETAAPADKAPGTGMSQFAHSLWQDLRGLVRVRYHSEVLRPMLPPEQQYFLRENLRLQLYGAQQALLQGNIAVYRQNLKSAVHGVKEYFDVNSQITVAMLSELEKLQTVRIASELPNISTSLEMLRQLSSRRTGP
jgi:uncharacterized protein HemX